MSEGYPQYSREHDNNDHEMHLPHEMLVKTIQYCEAICEHMIHHLMMKSDFEIRSRQIALLHDCADICTLTAKYIARESIFSKHMANLCAFVCDNCGNECAKFPDMESQHCAHICMNCAKECKEFATTKY